MLIVAYCLKFTTKEPEGRRQRASNVIRVGVKQEGQWQKPFPRFPFEQASGSLL